MIFTTMKNSLGDLLEQTKQLTFITELMSGNLAMDRFMFYIQQDLLYLNDYARALALVGARTDDNEYCKQFLHFAIGAIEAETSLHNDYLQRYKNNVSAETLSISPSCFMYTNYLLRIAALAPVEEAMAALLPCFWIYQEIGTYIATHYQQDNNPYKDWVDVYSGNDFAEPVQKMVAMVNEAAENTSHIIRDKMLNAFLTSSRLEWQFWHSAHCKETWPV